MSETGGRTHGVSLHTVEVGQGPTALVLHGGLGLDHQPYRSLDPLAESLRLVYYDHRGNGRSGAPVDTLTMARWADDVAELASAVAGDESVILVGHSYGGFIAQEAAIRHDERIRALVLLCTTPGRLGDGEEPAPEGPPIPEEFVEVLSALPETDDAAGVAFDRLAPAYLHSTSPDVLREWLRPVVYRAVAMRRGFEELAAWSSVDRLGSVRMPVLVVAGRHDAFTSWPQAERIASRVPDAEVVVFEDSGHFPWLEEPEGFFAAVTGWLERRGIVD